MYYLTLIIKGMRKLYWTGSQVSFIRENAKEYKTHSKCERALLKLRQTDKPEKEIFNSFKIDFD